MKRIHLAVGLFLVLVGLLCGCAGKNNPILAERPDISELSSEPDFQVDRTASRLLWGMWEVSVSEDHANASVVPLRNVQMHLNAVGFLEKFPCTTCLQISNVQPWPENKLSADLTLTHPFAGMPKLTGFDVRGIFVTEADFNFPINNRWIGWGDDIPRMLLPNGYTQLFNPWEYPANGPGAAMFKYIEGKFLTGGTLESTLNPYIAYKREEPRRMFESGSSETRTVWLRVPDGAFKFGYIVDACWAPVDGPVIDPVSDFPPDANCLEAYRVDVQVGSNLEPVVGSTVLIEAEVFDHQGLDTISKVTMEAPELFDGEIQLNYLEDTGAESHLFIGDLPNDHGAGTGEYPLLIRVTDTQDDENLGPIDAWFLYRVKVGSRNGWALTWGAPHSGPWRSDACLSADCDQWSNIYVTGYFWVYADMDPGSGEEWVFGQMGDVFLSKFDPDGNFIWTRTWGGDSGDQGTTVVVDVSGNVLVLAEGPGPVDMDPGPDEDIHDGRLMLSKFDPDGNYIWGCAWDANVFEEYKSLTLDKNENAYVTGYFSGQVDLDPGPGVVNRTATGFRDVFLSKFNSDGDFVWTRAWGGPGGTMEDNDLGMVVAVDCEDNILVSGRVSQTADFDPGEEIFEHEGGYFLSKFTPTGEFQGVHVSEASMEDLVFDESGNLFVLGNFHASIADLDPGPGVAEYTGPGYFVVRYDPSLVIQWVNIMENYPIEYLCLEVSATGDVFLTGEFKWNLVDFDPGPGTDYHGTVDAHDVFLSKFLDTGEYQWTRTWGGEGFEVGYTVASDTSGNAYVAGEFEYEVDFDPGPGTDFHLSVGWEDSFLSKIPPDGNW